MNKTMKAYKYDMNFAPDWWLNCYFGYKIEDVFSPLYSSLRYFQTLNDTYVSISQVVYFRYLGEWEVQIEDNGIVKEIAKISETK